MSELSHNAFFSVFGPTILATLRDPMLGKLPGGAQAIGLVSVLGSRCIEQNRTIERLRAELAVAREEREHVDAAAAVIGQKILEEIDRGVPR